MLMSGTCHSHRAMLLNLAAAMAPTYTYHVPVANPIAMCNDNNMSHEII